MVAQLAELRSECGDRQFDAPPLHHFNRARHSLALIHFQVSPEGKSLSATTTARPDGTLRAGLTLSSAQYSQLCDDYRRTCIFAIRFRTSTWKGSVFWI